MDRARCMYAEVVQADDRLRTAYAGATRAGVPRRTLSRYRDRWARLRRKALTDPDRVVSGYGQLARDLRGLRIAQAKPSPEYIADAY